ncbi:Rne/Rng family ribonuclease [Roseospira marina]|uniref:Ribonuclease E n=1 Tax=Roseospira marina TaxID=140057 RepID=A0A5M6I6L5_9PROT|nr:ribonuclease E/G [Roseospira marina]KAA5603846.1 Rne/Rng family ribonuclease [Roseospira marina]MBB4313765.1 ribonuclease E [Roseospira marina]MBB5086927.1 ribonuclease E [Roseospira marina]
MAKRLLIDTGHPEETRVVVLDGTRLEEFDVETSTKKQIKGNVYLAKVVRVEPSLQAAFVEYGGNRHGFLAFSEIHPDYYQIPVADRQALLAEQTERERAAEAEDDHHADSRDGDGVGGTDSDGGDDVSSGGARDVEDLGGEETVSAASPQLQANMLRNYKIQEVIKRRQILLVQVVKEERGNKGAALTTYLSLAGRYCVFMPNTARGGGVSRKISSQTDRRRLKNILSDLQGPPGGSVILRTAGAERSKAEIKRDFEYLMRQWELIKETTLQSVAPALIHEEANLIKRAIRDIYTRDVEEILVDGEEGYRAAKDFMKMLTPSHARKVKPYRDTTMPLLHRYQVESQLDAMHSPVAQLRSGGYVVINQTEALVAIDVNSGKSTKERHIEETALKTNLEAADEIARQLRLRDLAGLIVIDFIDMDDGRNNAAVERRMKEALKQDRARIQLSRISAFGLLEMSRQRLRPSLMETAFHTCGHCHGTGVVRSTESTAIAMLRVIEEEGVRRRSSEVTLRVPTPVALYILNNKRAMLTAIESRYDFRVAIEGDDSLIIPAYTMDRVRAENRPETAHDTTVGVPDTLAPEDVTDDDEVSETDETEDTDREAESHDTGGPRDDDDGGSRKKRRRRRRKPRRDGDGTDDGTDSGADGEDRDAGDSGDREDSDGEGADSDGSEDGADTGGDEDANARRSRRSRRRRGGRRNRSRSSGTDRMEGETLESAPTDTPNENDGGAKDAPAPAVATESPDPTDDETVTAEPGAAAPEPDGAQDREPDAEAASPDATEIPALLMSEATPTPEETAEVPAAAAESVEDTGSDDAAPAATDIEPVPRETDDTAPVETQPDDAAAEPEVAPEPTDTAPAEVEATAEAEPDADADAEPQPVRRGWWRR